jgi:hypothetical protein
MSSLLVQISGKKNGGMLKHGMLRRNKWAVLTILRLFRNSTPSWIRLHNAKSFIRTLLVPQRAHCTLLLAPIAQGAHVY